MSIQGSQIIPSTRYRDAYAAIEWLCRVLGFTQHAVYGDGAIVEHAQLTLGNGMFMLGSAANGGEMAGRMISPEATGGRETIVFCVAVEDCEAVYARAKEAGAEMVQELHEPGYGGKAFTCRDPEGHLWSVGSYDPWASHADPEAASA